MKSLITALWERSVIKQRVDPINPDPDAGMRFVIGEKRERGGCRFVLNHDTSLEHTTAENGDFSVYLGGNWRFELSVDCATGRCVKLTGFMSKLTAKQKSLAVPKAEPSVLICRSDRLLSEHFGCYSADPTNSVFFDPERLILCLGDPEAAGTAVEFADRTVAVIDSGHMRCVYLLLDNLENAVKGEDNLMNCIVMV